MRFYLTASGSLFDVEWDGRSYSSGPFRSGPGTVAA